MMLRSTMPLPAVESTSSDATFILALNMDEAADRDWQTSITG
jgi:hypothetical protein